MKIRKAYTNQFEIVKSLTSNKFYREYIVIKGSFIYLNIFKQIKRFPSDLDFCLELDCDFELKKRIIRKIISSCSCDVVLRDKISSPNQFGIFQKNDVHIKLEANVYSPTNRRLIKRVINCGSEAIEVYTYSTETMVVDKIFSLFYFVHPLFNGDISRFYDALYDVGVILNDKEFIKIFYDGHIEKAIVEKIRENIFGIHGFSIYVDFFLQNPNQWRINNENISAKYEAHCKSNGFYKNVALVEIVHILSDIRQKIATNQEIKKLLEIWKSENDI